MTRQNVTEGVREILTKTCPTCEGEGVVLSEETVAIDVERKLRELAAERPERRGVPDPGSTRASPRCWRAGPGRPLLEIEEETGKHFHFEGSEALPIDHFAVALEGARAEVEERALPFREGEEVLVTIEEPHMYAEDDAVAKIDGYVISVAGAGGLIGEKRLVRIEKVGRSAASATLVEGAEVVDPERRRGGAPRDDDPREDRARPGVARGAARRATAGLERRNGAEQPRRIPRRGCASRRARRPPMIRWLGAEPAASRRGRRGGRGRRKAAEADYAIYSAAAERRRCKREPQANRVTGPCSPTGLPRRPPLRRLGGLAARGRRRRRQRGRHRSSRAKPTPPSRTSRTPTRPTAEAATRQPISRTPNPTPTPVPRTRTRSTLGPPSTPCC